MLAKKYFARRDKKDKSRTQNGGKSSESNLSTQNNDDIFRCYKCDKPGHKASEYKIKKQAAKHAENVFLHTSDNSRVDSHICDHMWCLDSGATSHFVTKFRIFANL